MAEAGAAFRVSRVHNRTDSVAPDHPRPVRFRRRSVTRAHARDRVGGSERRLGPLPGGGDTGGGLVPRSPPHSPQPSGRLRAGPHMDSDQIGLEYWR